RRNVAVHAFNHRDIAGIFDMIRALGALVGVAGKADALVETLKRRLAQARTRAAALERHPRVYFEEWDEPMISGIRGPAELMKIAGGVDVFPALSRRKNAKDRIVSGQELIAAKPDIIVGSWCGKKFVPAKVVARPGFADVPAVRAGFLREIKSPLILPAGAGGVDRRARRARRHHRGMGRGAAGPRLTCAARHARRMRPCAEAVAIASADARPHFCWRRCCSPSLRRAIARTRKARAFAWSSTMATA